MAKKAANRSESAKASRRNKVGRHGHTKTRLQTGETQAKRDSGWEPSGTELECYHLACRGELSVRECAAKFGISDTAAHRLMHKVNDWLAREMMEKIRELKAEHCSRLMVIYTEAMKAWFRSQQDAVTVADTDGEKAHTTTTTKGQCGDPAYLHTAMKAMDDIRKIMGANAPLMVQHSGEVRVAGRTVDDARAELAQRLAEAQRRLVPSEN